MSASLSDDDYIECIREDITCGTCGSSTLIIWDRPSTTKRPPRDATLHTIKTDSAQNAIHVHYVVRCNFFKMTVTNPEDMVVCEGYQYSKES